MINANGNLASRTIRVTPVYVVETSYGRMLGHNPDRTSMRPYEDETIRFESESEAQHAGVLWCVEQPPEAKAYFRIHTLYVSEEA